MRVYASDLEAGLIIRIDGFPATSFSHASYTYIWLRASLFVPREHRYTQGGPKLISDEWSNVTGTGRSTIYGYARSWDAGVAASVQHRRRYLYHPTARCSVQLDLLVAVYQVSFFTARQLPARKHGVIQAAKSCAFALVKLLGDPSTPEPFQRDAQHLLEKRT